MLTNMTCSIIFIHGLTGDREDTWTADDASAPWPQDLLPTKLSQARILTFGYDANVATLQTMVSKNRIGNHAGALVSAIAAYRAEDDTVRTSRQHAVNAANNGRNNNRLSLSAIALGVSFAKM